MILLPLLLLLLTLLLLQAVALSTHGQHMGTSSRQLLPGRPVLAHGRLVCAAGASSSRLHQPQLQRSSPPAACITSHRQRSSSVRCRAVLLPLAMVNVDFASPSLVLGVTLIGCGIALLQVCCQASPATCMTAVVAA
jgi:hypothetical protein